MKKLVNISLLFAEGSNSLPANSVAERLLRSKYTEYVRNAKVYRFLYYLTRLLVALSAGLLPFFVSHNTNAVAVTLSLIVVIGVAIDSVFSPKDQWELFSRSTDLIAMAELKARGDFERYQEIMQIIQDTEHAARQRLRDIHELAHQAYEAESGKSQK